MSSHPRRIDGTIRPSADVDGPRDGSRDGPLEGLDGPAIEDLVTQHQAGVRSYLRYLGCSASSVDDLVQETFLTFLSAQFEPRDHRRTSRFLRSIARHLFLKSLRRVDRDALAVEFNDADAAWSAFRGDDGGAGYLDALKRCLSAVTGRTKEALALRYESGLGRSAIAEQLSLSESAVHSMLVRVRRSLRECVERKVQA